MLQQLSEILSVSTNVMSILLFVLIFLEFVLNSLFLACKYIEPSENAFKELIMIKLLYISIIINIILNSIIIIIYYYYYYYYY